MIKYRDMAFVVTNLFFFFVFIHIDIIILYSLCEIKAALRTVYIQKNKKNVGYH